MFKYAVMFLLISLIAGGLGLTRSSLWSWRVSMGLSAVFLLLCATTLGMMVFSG